MGALAAVLMGVSQIVQGYSTARSAEIQSAQTRLQGDAAMTQARVAAANNKNQAQRMMASQVAQGAGSGVSVQGNTSSLVSIINDTEEQARAEREMLLAQGRAEQANQYAAAATYKSAGDRAKKLGLLTGIATAGFGLYKAGTAGFDTLFSSTSSGATSTSASNEFINESLIQQSIPKWGA